MQKKRFERVEKKTMTRKRKKAVDLLLNSDELQNLRLSKPFTLSIHYNLHWQVILFLEQNQHDQPNKQEKSIQKRGGENGLLISGGWSIPATTLGRCRYATPVFLWFRSRFSLFFVSFFNLFILLSSSFLPCSITRKLSFHECLMTANSFFLPLPLFGHALNAGD
jgi:hypothetical protein